jgi:hypothetical protein
MIFRQIEPKDISELLKVRVSTRENTMTMEALADMGITPKSTIEALSVNVAGWLCEVSGNIVGFSMGDKNTGELSSWLFCLNTKIEELVNGSWSSCRTGFSRTRTRRYGYLRILIPMSVLMASTENYAGFQQVLMRVAIRF